MIKQPQSLNLKLRLKSIIKCADIIRLIVTDSTFHVQHVSIDKDSAMSFVDDFKFEYSEEVSENLKFITFKML